VGAAAAAGFVSILRFLEGLLGSSCTVCSITGLQQICSQPTLLQ
jgi:hypothetical protein